MVFGTSATAWADTNYVHAARIAGDRINNERPEMVDDPVTLLRKQDWFFEGEAAVTIPDTLKEIVGIVA